MWTGSGQEDTNLEATGNETNTTVMDDHEEEAKGKKVRLDYCTAGMTAAVVILFAISQDRRD